MDLIKGASYSDPSFLEEGSILILKTILYAHDQKFKSYISENDKTPNTDGKIEVLTESQSQYGLIDVQVKTLGKNKKTLSYSVELKLLAYVRDSSQIPFVLIIVDAESKKAYWKHIDSELAYSLIQKAIERDKKKDKTVTSESRIGVIFDEINELSNDQLWNNWRILIDDFKSRIQEYPKLKEDYDNLQMQIETLMKSNGDHSLPHDLSYVKVNMFLEALNSWLNKEFHILKSIYRIDFWRFGIDLLKYEDRSLAFSLKFMKWSDNVQQIRVLKVKGEKDFSDYIPNSFFFRAIGGINPIKDNPEKYAYELCYELFKYALKIEVFWFDVEPLKEEYIAMIHGNNGFAGINPQATFSLEELRLKINDFLTRMPKEKERMESFPEMTYNLIRALDYMQSFQINGITALRTRTRALNSIKSIHYNAVTYGEFPQNSDEIILEDWSRFLKAYDLVCEKYFSEFRDVLKYNDRFECEVLIPIIQKVRLENGHYLHHPFLLIYELAEIPPGHDRVIIRSDLTLDASKTSLSTVTFNDNNYDIIGWRTLRLTELSKTDLPLRNRILTFLDKKIDNYIKQLTK